MRKAVDTRRSNKVGNRTMYIRILIVFFIVLIGAIILIGRILYLNKVKGNNYERRVLAQQSYSRKEINYRRGDIVDRNGNKLATSKKVYDLILDPVQIQSDEKYIKATEAALKKVFDISVDDFQTILQKESESQYYPMKNYKGMGKTKVVIFKKMMKKDKNIKGVVFDERYERYYPYSTVASKIIGFCSSDNVGIWGIENQYNSKLSGVNGKSYGYFNSDLDLVENVKEPQNGNDVVSTIDVNVQGVLERHMKQFQKNTGSKNMGCIIMNPKNGEIYAMSSYPEYNLNSPRDLSVLYSKDKIAKMSNKEKGEALNQLWRNYCISDAYEPGSTFKPMTVAACLDEGITNPNRLYRCDGYQMVGGVKIKCVAYSRGGHGMINICTALMESCNDVMMQLGADLGKSKFLEYVYNFGFGRKTGIDLPGEAMGGVFNNNTMHSVELATSSFGQGQTVTMMQLASAFSATINGGNYYQPHIMKQIKSESGAVVSENNDALIRKVVTESTSKKIRQYLYKTVEKGTASPAQVKGYKIGGKTGTAEKHPTHHGNYLVSFVGFTPIDDPEVVVYTIIDEPHVADQAHSKFATIFSSQVMKEVLPLLGIYQDEKTKDTDKTKATDIKIPAMQEVPEGGYSSKDYPMVKSPDNKKKEE